MKLRQISIITIILVASNLAAWWLFRAQSQPTKWIGPSAFGAVTLGSLIIALVLAGFQARWPSLCEPTEPRTTPPDDSPWAAQALLLGTCDQQSLVADLSTARHLGALSYAGKTPQLSTAAAEVLPDRLQRILVPLNCAKGRSHNQKLKQIRAIATRQTSGQITYLPRYAMLIGMLLLVIGLGIAAPLGETTSPWASVLSWVIAVFLCAGSSRVVRGMMWSAKPRLPEATAIAYSLLVLVLAGLQVKWPDSMPFWFLGFTAMTAGGLWPLCWSVKRKYKDSQAQWAAYWLYLRSVAAVSNDPAVLERHQSMLIALHLWRLK